ncbi:MAG TPA: aldolase/citrate lyase family protein [Aggregatilineales bacterium]|nr:aldolase/citrate lyase family protein [Aggregatilineales bacterium]
MRTNHIKERMARGEACRGLWLNVPSMATARLIARLPLDWMLVDMEHAPMTVEIMFQMVSTIIDAHGPAPFVRLPEAVPAYVKYALDAGAWGIIAPMVNSRAQAETVVQAAKYPPHGQRSYGGPWVGLTFELDNPAYYRQANQQTLAGVQIESQTALDNLEAILSVPNLDMVYVGPVDLSLSLGLDPTPEQDAPPFMAAIDRILEAARRYRLPAGIYCSNAASAAERIRQGFQFVNVGADTGALLNGIRAQL